MHSQRHMPYVQWQGICKLTTHLVNPAGVRDQPHAVARNRGDGVSSFFSAASVSPFGRVARPAQSSPSGSLETIADRTAVDSAVLAALIFQP